VVQLDAIAEKLIRLGRDPGRGPSEDGPHAAVAAILREGPAGDGAQLFFIRRAESATDPWSGHIAFPGGRHEPSDESLLATAIRETREEVGIDLGRAELLARLPDVPAFVRSRRGTLVVTAFVFALREPVVPTPNAEVADTLWVAVERLAIGEGRGTYSFQYDDKPYEVPCVRLQPGQHVLWGMTHRMTEAMLEALS
jgi:8-oxo-dGTP pyrophosphatase MutT (NUDIX family)